MSVLRKIFNVKPENKEGNEMGARWKWTLSRVARLLSINLAQRSRKILTKKVGERGLSRRQASQLAAHPKHIFNTKRLRQWDCQCFVFDAWENSCEKRSNKWGNSFCKSFARSGRKFPSSTQCYFYCSPHEIQFTLSWEFCFYFMLQNEKNFHNTPAAAAANSDVGWGNVKCMT